jgi:hypothetical protein
MDHRDPAGGFCRVQGVVPTEYCTCDPSQKIDVCVSRISTVIASNCHLQAGCDSQDKKDDRCLEKEFPACLVVPSRCWRPGSLWG